MSIKLTQKQEQFLQGLLKGMSQREAYKNAYNASKMKDETIDVKACQLLKSDKVAIRYDELKGKIIDKIAEEGLLSATDTLKKVHDLIIRNEGKDDKTALKGLEFYGKYHKLLTDKVEHSGEVNIPQIIIKRGKDDE